MHLAKLLFSLFLIQGCIGQIMQAKTASELSISNCIFAQQVKYLIYLCSDSIVISQLSSPSENVTIHLTLDQKNTKLVGNSLRSQHNYIYLYRDTELIEIDVPKIFERNTSKPYSIFPLRDYDLDAKSNIIASGEYLIFKKKHFCNVHISKFRDDSIGAIRPIFEVDGSRDDCKINFSAATFDDKIVIDIFLKETSNLITYSTNYITTDRIREYYFTPTIFQLQFDQFALDSYNDGKLILSTYNSFEDIECLYLFNSNLWQFHLEYSICDNVIDKTLHDHSIFITAFNTFSSILTIVRLNYLFPDAPPDVLVSTVNYQHSYQNERYILTKYGMKPKLDLIYEKEIEYCISSNLNPKNLLFCKTEIFEDEPNCNEFRHRNGYHDLIESQHDKCLGNMFTPEILRICSACKPFKGSECKSCLENSIYKCPSVNSYTYCRDHSVTAIVTNECGLEIKKINEKFQISMVLRQLINADLRCIFFFDFGTTSKEVLYSFWRSNQSSLINSKANVELYDKKFKIKSVARDIDGLNLRYHYIAVNSILIDYRITFGGEIASQYTVWFVTPLITVHSCISCVLDQGASLVKSNNIIVWNSQRGECILIDKINNERAQGYRKWYECFSQDFGTMNGICEIKQDSRDKILISIREQYDYPYCKLRIPIGDRSELYLSYIQENYEDVVIQYDDKFYNMKDSDPQHEGRITDILHVTKVSWMSILFLSRNPNETVAAKRELSINFDVGKNDPVSILGLIIINVVGMVLIMFICFCRSSGDDTEIVSDSPYYIADFATGCPKKIKIKQSKIKELEKLGFTITKDGNPVNLETSECCICLDLNVEREFRVFLCGRHYVHSDCFQCWFDAQIDNDSKELCPMRCKQILLSTTAVKKSAREKPTNKETTPTKQPEDKKEPVPEIVIAPNIEPKEQIDTTEPSENNSPPIDPKYDPDATANIFKNPDDTSMFENTVIDQNVGQTSQLDKTDGQILNTSEWEIDIDMDRERSLSNIHLLKNNGGITSTSYSEQKNY